MRKVRMTFIDAYHHIMNRGIDDTPILSDDRLKKFFLELIREKSRKLKIRLFAYCLMDTHYHLILQNSSGKLIDFMRQVNGQFGIRYRKIKGGKGYVFQGRYKSTLIQATPYLVMSVIYVLLNPVRAGLIENPYDYQWSSIQEYYTPSKDCTLDHSLIENVFENYDMMKRMLEEWCGKRLPIKKTRCGTVLGDIGFEKEAMTQFNRRVVNHKSIRMRTDDCHFETADKVIRTFERTKGITLEGIRLNTLQGKKLRSELLLQLRDKAGLSFKIIGGHPFFQSVKYSSLAKIYQRARGQVFD
ncbi:MAG: transposase [Spirochaetes bacterium]|nr:transposase [Spirochaetota bacterium]